jgi:hypothetical protein
MTKQLQTETSQLEKENSMLKEQVVRLNKELSNYQKTAGIKPLTDSSQRNCIDIPDSIADCEAIVPLFTAYDHRIEELSNFIEKQGSVLEILTQRSNDLISENENLRNRLVQSLPSKKADSNEMSTRDVCTKQLLSDKHLLEEQAELLVRELNSANKVIASRDENISSLSNQIKNKLTIIQDLSTKVQRLLKEKGNCEKELISRIKTIAFQSNQIEDLKDSVDKLKNGQTHMLSKTECVRMDKHYLEVENEALTRKVCIFILSKKFIIKHEIALKKFLLFFILITKITQSASLIQDLKDQLSIGADEYMKLNESYLTVKKTSEDALSEIEKVNQSHNELKIHFNLAHDSEKDLLRVQHELATKLKEVELSRDKALAISSSLEKELNRLLLQAKEDDANNCSSRILLWQNDTCKEIKRRDQLIHTLKLQHNELTIQADNDSRQSNLSQTTLDNLEKSIQKERIKTKSAINELQTQLSNLEAKWKAEYLQKSELVNKNCALQQEVASLQDGANTNKIEMHNLRLEEKRKNQQHVKAQQRLQTKIDELNTRLQIETAKIMEEKEILEIELDEIKHQKEIKFDAIQCKNQQLEQSMKEISKSNKLLREEIESIVQANEIVKKETEAQHREKLVEFQALLDDQLRKNQELLTNIGAVAEENFNFGVMLKKKDQQVYRSEQKLIEAEAKVSSLSLQLHDNLSDQSKKISQIKALKTELRELKIKTAEI